MLSSYQLWHAGSLHDTEGHIPLREVYPSDFSNKKERGRYSALSMLMSYVDEMAARENEEWRLALEDTGGFSFEQAAAVYMQLSAKEDFLPKTSSKGRARRLNELRWPSLVEEVRKVKKSRFTSAEEGNE